MRPEVPESCLVEKISQLSRKLLSEMKETTLGGLAREFACFSSQFRAENFRAQM